LKARTGWNPDLRARYAKVADPNRTTAGAFAANVLPIVRQIEAARATPHRVIDRQTRRNAQITWRPSQ
jgi:hypothetical protein